MKLEDVRVHVGGPHGNLQVDPALCDHVVLCAGGIGVTPMAAILEDRVRGARSGAIRSGSKTTLVWTTRSPAEVAAFSYLFAAIAQLSDEARSAFDVRVHLTGGAKADPETATYAAGVAAIAMGRPDFDAVYVDHPIQDQNAQEIAARAEAAVAELAQRLTAPVSL